MNSYERVLQMSADRIQDTEFRSLREIGHITLNHMAVFSGFLTKEYKKPFGNGSDDARSKYNRDLLAKRGVYAAKKASIIFGQLDNSDETVALPVVAAKDSSIDAWHNNAVKDYKTEIINNGGSFTNATNPNIFSGEVMLRRGSDKPIIAVHVWSSIESLDTRESMIKQLSIDFPQSTVAVSKSDTEFMLFDNGTAETIKLAKQ